MFQHAAVTVLTSAAAAVAVLWLSQRLLKGAAKRGSGAVAFAAAFWLGYAMLAWLQSRSDFAPTDYWKWIPYATLLASAVGAVTASVKMPLVGRCALFATAAVLSAWLITPTWPDLEPPRAALIPVVTIYFFLLAALVEPLAPRFPCPVVASHFALAAACSAALVFRLASVVYGEAAAIAAGALAGCAVGAWLFPDVAVTRSLALVYAIAVGGWAFGGAIYARPAQLILFVAPLAPLALWICAVGPLARKRGITAIAIQTAAVLTVLALAAGLGWIATSNDGDGNW
jgi:hypothetical protein